VTVNSVNSVVRGADRSGYSSIGRRSTEIAVTGVPAG
jgi:hypothetical protein